MAGVGQHQLQAAAVLRSGGTHQQAFFFQTIE